MKIEETEGEIRHFLYFVFFCRLVAPSLNSLSVYMIRTL